MASLQKIETTILRETLEDLASIQGLIPLAGSPGHYKIFWRFVPDSIEMPYIVLRHLAGGYDNDAQSEASDSLWKIDGVTVDYATRESLSDAIAELHRKDPISTTFPNSCGYTWITEELPTHEVKLAENHPILYVGGIYRLRLSHN